MDSQGNVYVADRQYNRIQKLTVSTGIWTAWGRDNGDNGTGLGEFDTPDGVAVDNNDNLYVADSDNHRIQKLTVSTGVWSEWGKNGSQPGTGLGEFYFPEGIAVDNSGNVYVAERGNHRIQKLTAATGVWSEWKKSGGGNGSGLGEFDNPTGVAVDGSGDLYVADSVNHRIQKLTVATGEWSEWKKPGGGTGEGLGEFNYPRGVAVDSNGNVYVADAGNHRILKLTVATGEWSEWKKPGGGTGEGFGEFNTPNAVAIDSSGNVYVADYNNQRIQKLTAATGDWSGWGAFGPAPSEALGEFDRPTGVAADSAGNIYVSELSGRIQKLTASTSVWSEWKKSSGGNGNGLGEFNLPMGVAADGSGNVYVADTMNNRIQKLTESTGVWSEWKKSGGGAGSGLGEFTRPGGVAVDSDGNVYVADTYNNRIQKLTVSTGVWSEWKKSGGGAGSGLGEFSRPGGVAVDSSGNVYVADTNNSRIQKLTVSTGVWSEWVKSGGGAGNGPGEFNMPNGVAVDYSGNVYVADSRNHRIQKLTVSTGAWSEWPSNGGGAGDGLGEFSGPYGVVVDGKGNVYVADLGNNRIQKLTMPSPPTGVTAVAGDRQAVVSFTASDDGGSPITGFTVTANPGGITVSGVSSPITVTGLTNDTTYTFTVTAINSAGSSVASDASSVTPQVPAPGAPVLHSPVAGNAQVSLAWSPVAGSIGYKVFQSVGAATYGSEVTSVSGSVYSYSVTDSVYRSTLTGLANGTTYYFTVKAINAGGESAASNQVSAMPMTVPGAPTGVAAVAGNGQAAISFTPPTDNGGSVITGYEVTASPGDIVGTGTASPITVKGLTNGTAYTFIVKAINAAGKSIASAESEAVVPQSPSSDGGGGNDSSGSDDDGGGNAVGGGGGGGGNGSSNEDAPIEPAAPATQETANAGVEVLVNGKAENAGTSEITRRNDQQVTTVEIDQTKLDGKLAQEGQGTVVTIPVNTGSDIIVGELNGQMVKNMENKQAVLEIKTERATYTLPAQQINIDAISGQIGESVALQDIKVQIEIAALTTETLKVVEDAANKGSFELVVPPLDFTIRGIYEDQWIEISKFNAYVERTIAIPDGIDPNKITTGVVIASDGTVRHVPTKVVNVDGKYYAQINSLTNSTYSVVWHPLEFSDVANHWAKQAVNGMGSRMVIEGTGNGMFSPDRDMTRAEFAAIIIRGLGLETVDGATPFSDVNPEDWYSKAVNTAYSYNLIGGFDDGTFRPLDKITREQAMVIFSNAMEVTGLKNKLPNIPIDEILRPFEDEAELSDWAQRSVADSVQAGIVSGIGADELAPKGYVTRAEAAVMIQSLLQKSGLI